MTQAQPLHPFYPLEAQVIGFLANDLSISQLLTTFFAGCGLILAVSLVIIQVYNASLSNIQKATALWFVLCGFIHFFFEGYFAVNHYQMPSRLDLFGQLWKEYSHSDSRYMTSDPFVLCMETITAICWGPLSFVVAGLIISSSPLRHPLQIVVSLGQLYGDVLYYATSMFDLYYKGMTYCRPEPYYFWFYYVFLNFFWIVIPAILMYSSISHCAEALSWYEKSQSSKLARGAAKKRA